MKAKRANAFDCNLQPMVVKNLQTLQALSSNVCASCDLGDPCQQLENWSHCGMGSINNERMGPSIIEEGPFNNSIVTLFMACAILAEVRACTLCSREPTLRKNGSVRILRSPAMHEMEPRANLDLTGSERAQDATESQLCENTSLCEF